MRDVFEKHVPYEIDRLVDIYKLLLQPKRYRSGLTCEIAKTVENALIVGFCTHARNLLEFFFREHPTKYKYAIARGYATTQYAPLEKAGDVETLYEQLCAQINHLTYKRTHETAEQIGAKERIHLVKIIHEEAERLGEYLLLAYDKQHLRIDRLAEAAATEVTKEAAGTTASIHYGGSEPVELAKEAKGLK
jgi:hypothetical protein